MKSFISLLEELSKDELDKHLSKNTAIRMKNKNFKLRGRMMFAGIPISIENYKGDTRAGVDPDGEPWIQTMSFDYGFIPNKISADDGEGIDVYVGPDKTSENVYVVKQHKIEELKNWKTNKCPQCKNNYEECHCPEFFDEDKVMLGFPDKKSARSGYLKQYDDPRFLGPIADYSLMEFKELLSGKKKTDKITIPFKINEMLNEEIEDLSDIIKNIEKSKVDYSSKLVNVNVAKFDKEWKKDTDFYIGKGGTLNAIGDRYERFLKILNMPKEERARWFGESKNGNVIASSVSVNNEGLISFSNGRHRFAVLRDLGIKKIPVAMTKDSATNAKKYKYI